MDYPRSHNSNNAASIICDLALKNQYLIHRSLDLGLYREAKRLQRLDDGLRWFFQKAVDFSIVNAIATGRTLLVGEGNLSFALSLARKKSINPTQLVATTFEAKNELVETAADNSKVLRALGAVVLHGVDATKLPATLGSWKFHNIAFQFPHVGSREPIEGRNPNFILVRNFLKSAFGQLTASGQVLITAVDSPHYEGAFQFDEAAQIAGFKKPFSYPFEPSEFSGYTHTMTNEDESALGQHDAFRTWVFKKI